MNSKSIASYDGIMSCLFFLFMILIPFQDSGLSETPLRMFGRYLSNFPLAVMLILSIFHSIMLGKVKKQYMILVCIFCYIFIFSLSVTIFRGDDLTASLYKIGTNSILLVFLIASFYYALHYFPIIKKYIWLVLLVDLLGCLLCDVLTINPGTLIHGSFSEYGRFRGFSSEASWFGYTTIILGLLASVCTSSRILKYGYLLISVIIVFVGGSKGTIACIPLAVLFYIIWGGSGHKWLRVLLVPLSLLLCYEVFSIFLIESFTYDLEESTSVSTRFSSMIAGVLIFFHYPFGTGFGSSGPVLREFLFQGYDLLNQYFPVFVLSYNEIAYVINDPNGVGLTIKNNFIQYLSLFGIPFIYILYKLVQKSVFIFKGTRIIYIVSIYFIAISVFSFAQLFYDTTLAIAALSVLAKRDKNYGQIHHDSKNELM